MADKYLTQDVLEYFWNKIKSYGTATFSSKEHTHPSGVISSLEGYSKAKTASPVSEADTLNAAIGKIEAGLDEAVHKSGNENVSGTKTFSAAPVVKAGAVDKSGTENVSETESAVFYVKDASNASFAQIIARRHDSAGINELRIRGTNAEGKWADLRLQFSDDNTYGLYLAGSGGMASQGFLGNASTASALKTARKLKADLSATADAPFDGSADQTAIPVQGILPASKGGTGLSTLDSFVRTTGTQEIGGEKTFTEPLNASITGTAAMASADADGNAISTTYAKVASAALTGTPTAPNPSAGDSSTRIATTKFVSDAIAAQGIGSMSEAIEDQADQIEGISDALDGKLDSSSSAYLKSISIDGTQVTVVKGDGSSETMSTQDRDTHWTTKAVVGPADGTSSSAVDNPYLRIFDNNTARATFQISGSGAASVSSDSLGNITVSSTDTTYGEMAGASQSRDGTSGLVPAPEAEDAGKFLRGDGSWALPEGVDPASAAPLASGTASVGASLKYAREDHVHPEQEKISAVPEGTTYVAGASAGKALVTSETTSYGAVFNAPTKTGRVSLGTNPSSNDLVSLMSFTSENVASGTNEARKTMTWNASDGTLTVDKIVADIAGDVTGNVTGSSGSCTGNAATASKFAASQTISLSGDVSGSASSQAGWNISTTLKDVLSGTGTFGPDSASETPAHGASFKVPYVTVDSKGRVTAISNRTVTLPASGNTDVKVRQETASDNAERPILARKGVSDASGTANYAAYDSGVTVNASTHKVTASGGFVGDLEGTAESALTVPWSGIEDRPSTFTPAEHSHSGSDVSLTGYAKASSASAVSASDSVSAAIGKLEKALDGKQASGSYASASHNQASNTINAMTGYSKPSSTSAIGTSDTLNGAIGKLEKALDGKASSSHSHPASDVTLAGYSKQTTAAPVDETDSVYTAIGKLEKALDGKQAAGSYAASSHNQASSTINAMTGYSKPSSTSAIAASDTLNAAIGKLEKALDGKQASGSYAAASHNQASSTIDAMTGYAKASSAGAISTSDTLNSAIGKLEKALDGKQASGSYAASSHTHSSSSVTAMTDYAKASSAGAISTSDTLNSAIGKLEKALDGKANTSHGTHVSFSTDAPKAAGTASAGGSSTTTVAKSDHVHPLQTSVSGNAGTATKFSEAQTVELKGAVTGSASSQAGWTVTTTLADSGVTADTYGSTAQQTPAHGSTFSIPYVTVDAKGRVTAAGTSTVKLPADSNTDTKVNVTLGTTTKAYLLGTSTTPTSTAAGVTAISDTGVYLDTTAGRLTAGSFAGNGQNITLGTANAIVTTDANKKLTASTSITATELGYLDGVTSSIQTQLNGKAASSHSHDASDISSGTLDTARIPSLDASKITSGTIDIARLPVGALERLVIVDNETKRFALTAASVQIGDTVKQEDTGQMYFVVDTSKLDSAAGYEEYTAGSATSVPWSGVTDKPSTFAPAAHNQASSTINAMTGYSKPSSTSAIGTSDTLNSAIGKLEKALDGKQASGSYASSTHSHTGADIPLTGYVKASSASAVDAADSANAAIGKLEKALDGKAATTHSQTSSTINAMTGYSKPSSTSAISANDTLNAAIGKLEKALDGKQASGSYASASHNQASSTINAMTGYAKASAAAAIAVTDTLNAAIGKLEKALDGKQASGSYLTSSSSLNAAKLTGTAAVNTTGKATTAGTADKVANSLTLKVKSGTTEGTDLYTFNGSGAKTLDIKQGSNVTLTAAEGSLTIAAKDTVYTHPTTSGNKHVPSGGSSGQFLGWDSDGTAKWVANPNADTKVKQYVGNTSTERPILSRYTIDEASQTANYVVYDTGVTNNPNKHTLTSSGGFIGKLSGTPEGTTFVAAVTEGKALVNATTTGYGGIWNAPTKNYRVGCSTYPSSGDDVRIAYSVTNANVTAGTNTVAKSLTWNADSGTLTATAFSGPLTGNVTGNVSGSSGSCTGNATTATKLATARTINGVSFDGSANITVADSTKLPLAGGTVTGTLILSRTQDADATSNSKPALIVGGSDTAAHIEIDANEVMAKGSGTTTAALYLNAGGGDVYIGGNTANYKSVTGRGKGSTSLPVYTDENGIVTACGTSLGVSITGNAATATKLATARTINGVSFDGSANITVADSTKVAKAGDTMTGNLTISKAGPVLCTKSTGMTRNTAPSAAVNTVEILGQDNAGKSTWGIYHTYGTDMANRAQLIAYNGKSTDNTWAGIGIGYDVSGNVSTNAPTPSTRDNSTKIATTAYVTSSAARHITAATTIYASNTGTGDGSTAAKAMSLADLSQYLSVAHSHCATTGFDTTYKLTVLFVPTGTSYGTMVFDSSKMPGIKYLTIGTSTGTASTTSNYSTNSPLFGSLMVRGDGLDVTVSNIEVDGTVSAYYGAKLTVSGYVGAGKFAASNRGRLDVGNGTYNIHNKGTDILFHATEYGQLIINSATANVNFREQCWYTSSIFYSDTTGRIYINYSRMKLTGTQPVVSLTASGTLTGTSSTAAGTAAKAVTLADGQTFTLAANAIAYVKFTNANTAANPTLNINGTGAKAIWLDGAAIPKNYLNTHIQYKFTYDGTRYICGNTFQRVEVATNNSHMQYSGAYTTTYNEGTFNWTGFERVRSNGANVNGQLQGDINGNAATATALKTARTINGVSFDGSANITVADSTKVAKTGDTMSGILTISKAGEAMFHSKSTGNSTAANNWECMIGIGSSGKGGLYDNTRGYYIIERAPTTGVVTIVAKKDDKSATGTYTFGTDGKLTATTFAGALSGNAATATKLATAKKINGVSFDGSADITVADSTKLPLAGGTMTGNITMSASKSIIFDLSATTPTASTVRNFPIQFKSQSTAGNFAFAQNPFFEIPLEQTSNYGMGIGFSCSGLTIIGGGEAGRGIVEAESLTGGTEKIILASDGAIDFFTNCNTIANRVKTSIDTAGNFSGNAATATKLATARTINGVSFDGSANITVADSTKVAKAGDTMTGVLKTTVSGSAIQLYSQNMVKGTAPSSNQYEYIEFFDKNSKRMGLACCQYNTNKHTRFYIGARKSNEAGDTAEAALSAEIAADGTTYGTAPTPSSATDNSTKIATTAWVRTATGNFACNAATATAATTATKFASAQSVALTGAITGTASSQAGWSVSTVWRSCMVGQSGSTTTNPWYKVATFAVTTANDDIMATFLVEDTYSSHKQGILKVHVRTDGSKVISSTASDLIWLSHTGFTLADFVLVCPTAASSTVEIWTKIATAYMHRRFTVLSEGSRSSTSIRWTLLNASSAGQAASITTTGTQIASTLAGQAASCTTCTGNAATATKLATARSLWGNNFDGSAAISGSITISAAAGKVISKNSNVTRNTAPSANQWNQGLCFQDKDGVALGGVEHGYLTDKTNRLNLIVYKGTTTDTSSNAQISVGYDKDGNWFTNAPTPATADNTTKIATTAFVKAQGYITASGSITGNAATATKLATARTINGVSFDGSANITVADSTKVPLSGGTMTGSLTQKHTGLVKGSTVSAWTCRDYRVIDNSGDSGDKPCLSWWRTAVGTDQKVSVTINAFKFADESTASASIGIHYPISGDPYTSAPTPATADNSTKIATTAYVKAQGYITASGSITGNAATATKLATARALWGNNFDGSAAVTGSITLTDKSIIFDNSTLDYNVAPSANVTQGGLYWRDKNDKYVARMLYYKNTDKTMGMSFGMCKHGTTNSDGYTTLLGMAMNADGSVKYASCPTPAAGDSSTKIATTAFVASKFHFSTSAPSDSTGANGDLWYQYV